MPASSDITAMLVAIGAENAPPELGGVDARRALVRLAMTGDLTIAGLRGPRDTSCMLHRRCQRSFWLEPKGRVTSPWVKLWRMLDADTWNVLPNDLGDQIRVRCGSLNLRNVEESTVIIDFGTRRFQPSGSAEFSAAERI